MICVAELSLTSFDFYYQAELVVGEVLAMERLFRCLMNVHSVTMVGMNLRSSCEKMMHSLVEASIHLWYTRVEPAVSYVCRFSADDSNTVQYASCFIVTARVPPPSPPFVCHTMTTTTYTSCLLSVCYD